LGLCQEPVICFDHTSTRSRTREGTINKQQNKEGERRMPHAVRRAPPTIAFIHQSINRIHQPSLIPFDSPSSTNDIYLQPTPGDTDYTTTSTTSLGKSLSDVVFGFGWFGLRRGRRGDRTKDKGISRRWFRCQKMKEVIVLSYYRTSDKVDGGCTSCGSQRSRTSKQENVDDISTTSY
jgi:hypothetical protein